jgi:tetratricopeptide (TPR) repeat protein
MKSLIAALTLCLATAGAVQAAPIDAELLSLAQRWDHANFEIKDAALRLSELKKLEAEAASLSAKNPKSADAVAWDGIIVSSEAGATSGLGALGYAKNAKKLFEKAATLSPNALGDGSVNTSLGSLYTQVPGFPIGFGDPAKAKQYLTKGLAQNPTGLDANFFEGDYLFRQKQYVEAKKALEAALNAPARPGREIGDMGRKAEAATLLAKVNSKLGQH